MKIELTRQQVQALFEIIDMAVRAHGVKIAANCAILANKLEEAAKAELEAEAAEPELPLDKAA